jgi:valyl-tRNA synthetase
MAAPGTDIVLSDDRLASSRNFANKIWNAARFLFMNLDKFESGGAKIEDLAAPEVRAGAPYAYAGQIPLIDRWLYARLAMTISNVNQALESYRFHEAAQTVYQFFWGDFCDWYIEWVKPELTGADQGRATVAWRNLFAAFDAALRLLHPLMPFLTEELWHQLPQEAGSRSIALERFPAARAEWNDTQALRQFGLLQEVTASLRNIRAEMKVDPKKKLAGEFSSADSAFRELVQANRDGILRAAMLSDLKIGGERLPQAGGAVRSTAEFDARIPYEQAADMEAEKSRLQKEIDRLTKDIAAKDRQLADETFRSRAPEKIVRGIETTLAERRAELAKLTDRIAQLPKN